MKTKISGLLLSVFLSCSSAFAQDVNNPQTNASALTTGTLAAAQGGSGNNSCSSSVTAGTFTPTLTFGGASVGQTGSYLGNYSKSCKIVTFTIRITLTAKGSSTGTAIVGTGAMPAPLPSGNHTAISCWVSAGMQALSTPLQCLLLSNNTGIQMGGVSLGSQSVFTDSAFSNSSDLIFSGSYISQ